MHGGGDLKQLQPGSRGALSVKSNSRKGVPVWNSIILPILFLEYFLPALDLLQTEDINTPHLVNLVTAPDAAEEPQEADGLLQPIENVQGKILVAWCKTLAAGVS
jgi:hypothetical protein